MPGLDSLLGQEELKKRLGKAVRQLPGHSFVFIGPDGIGKTSFARAFAQALLCETPDAGEACGRCPSCRYFDSGTHPDYKELLLQEKEKNIKTDLIRRAVCGDIAMLPQISSRKVYLIDADDLNESGQNVLLKTLEEPPEYAVILLTVSEAGNLLPTILSRVIQVPLRRNTAAEVEQILRRRGVGGDDAPTHFLAKFSDGIPGVAIQLYESGLFAKQREEVLDLMAKLPSASRADLLIDYYAYFDSNKAQASDLLEIMSTWVRDMAILSACGDLAELINEDRREKLRDCCPAGPNAARALAGAERIIHSARRGLSLNSSFENCICTMLLQLRKELMNA